MGSKDGILAKLEQVDNDLDGSDSEGMDNGDNHSEGMEDDHTAAKEDIYLVPH